MEQSIIDDIQQFYPCQEGFEWFKQQPSLEEAWLKCERPDWMLWYLRRKQIGSKEQFVRIALFCAKEAHPYSKNKKADQKAIEAVEAWLNSPTEENRIKCEKAAHAARYAAADAAYAANAANAANAKRTEWRIAQSKKLIELLKAAK